MNRLRTIGRLMFAVFLFAGSAFGDDASDARIKSVIVGSTLYIDNPNLAIEDFRYAKGLCAGDTNRFARLLCEAANTNNAWISDQLISDLGYHGTSAQLPFLYSMATNVHHGASAVESILRLEGVTSNSLGLAMSYLSMTNVSFKLRADVCKSLLSAAAKTNVTGFARQRAMDVVYRYALRTNGSVVYIDYVFTTGDPTYRFSKRRLAVMRSVLARGVHSSSTNYVTNVINELVAYPEANLTE